MDLNLNDYENPEMNDFKGNRALPSPKASRTLGYLSDKRGPRQRKGEVQIFSLDIFLCYPRN